MPDVAGDRDAIIVLKDVHLELESAAGPVNILRGIDLQVDRGERVSVVGPSGSGKSTMMMIIGGLERPSSGATDVAGHDLNYIGDAGLLALSMGSQEQPVVPPALIADIAAGAYPAVMNILLALTERARTGRGRYLDVAMADNLFPFMYWALGNGLVAGEWPGNGTDLVTGGTPRYRLYPTADGRMVAAAPIEQRFWTVFCDVIGLNPDLCDDSRDPAATAKRMVLRRSPLAAARFEEIGPAGDHIGSVRRDKDGGLPLAVAVFDPLERVAQGARRALADGGDDLLSARPIGVDPGLLFHAEYGGESVGAMSDVRTRSR